MDKALQTTCRQHRSRFSWRFSLSLLPRRKGGAHCYSPKLLAVPVLPLEAVVLLGDISHLWRPTETLVSISATGVQLLADAGCCGPAVPSTTTSLVLFSWGLPFIQLLPSLTGDWDIDSAATKMKELSSGHCYLWRCASL